MDDSGDDVSANYSYSEDDEDNNEENYAKLQASVAQLDSSQRIRAAKRNELGSLISEYYVNEKGKASVATQELASVLGKKKEVLKVQKKIKNVASKSKKLPKPLLKPVVEQIKRKIGYAVVNQQLKSWEPVVESFRVADHVVFPLNTPSCSILDHKVIKRVNQTQLEKELNAVLHGEQDDKVKTQEEEDEFPLTLDELMERRKELATIRRRQSYKEAKAYRQSKIKSKKYHRMQKREKVKQQLKEFEILQKTDPAAALKKLEELEKGRAEERATLRHKSTGKWAKNLTVRAKYDKESRKVLAEQLAVSRDITQKVKQDDSSEDEGPDIIETALNIAESNPWSLEVTQDVNSFISGFKQYWTKKGQSPKKMNTENEDSLIIPENTNTVDVEIGIISEDTNTNAVNLETVVTPEETNTNTVIEGTDHIPKEINGAEEAAFIPEKHSTNNDNEESVVISKEINCKPSNEDSSVTPVGKKSSPKKTNKKKSLKLGSSGKWSVSPVVAQSATLKRKIVDIDIDDAFYEADDKLAKKITEKFKIFNNNFKTKPRKEKKHGSLEKSESYLAMKKSRWHVERAQVDQELGNDTLMDNTEPSSISIQPVLLDNKNILPEKDNLQKNPYDLNIDPDKFMKVKSKEIKTPSGENVTKGDLDALDDDDEDNQEKFIMEAFAEDNVTDFREAKESEEKLTKPEVIQSLPGWGSWGGTGVVTTKRRRRRFQLPKLPPRKDKNLNDIIINENANPNVTNHMVKEVPFPFQSVAAFESNIRAPISRDWIPEMTHRELILPTVLTKMGSIIEPMSDNVLLRNRPKPRSVFKSKVKKGK